MIITISLKRSTGPDVYHFSVLKWSLDRAGPAENLEISLFGAMSNNAIRSAICNKGT